MTTLERALRRHLLAGVATGIAALGLPATAGAYEIPEWLKASFGGSAVRALPESVRAKPSALPENGFVTAEYRFNHGLAQINAAEAYELGFTGKGVLVAVVDSGLDTRLPEFAGRVSHLSRNFGFDGLAPTDVTDSDSHGTHVAGTIAANRDMIGMHGVAFNAEILALRAVVDDPGGDTAAAVEYAAAHGAKVLNGSYGPIYPGRFLEDGSPNPDYVLVTQQNYDKADVLQDVTAGRRAAAADMVMVFAAGNERDDQPIIGQHPTGAAFFPAMRPSNAASGLYGVIDGHSMVDLGQIDFSDLQPYTLAVVAVDVNNKLASFSNKCGLAAAWCLAAPGVGIMATVPQGMGTAPGYNYGPMSGTSMAAPHVAGAAALVREALPFLTAPQVTQTILTTATDLGDKDSFGWGLLNAGKAVRGPGQFLSTFDVDTKGASGTFSNDIAGVGGLIKRGEGRLELAGANSYAGTTSVVGGTLALNGSVTSAVDVGSGGTLRGSGLVNAALSSAGTVRPGNSPGTLTVAGPITLGSTGQVVFDIDGAGTGSGAGNHSRLVGLGASATVSAGGRLVPVLRGISGSATNTFSPTLGQSFGVIAASGLTGSFAGIDQPAAGLPEATRFDAVYHDASLDLVVTPQSYAALSSVGIAQNGNASAVGGALDALRPAAGTRPDGARRAVFDALYGMAPGSLGSALGSLSGQQYADAAAAQLSTSRLLTGTIDRRLTEAGTGQGVTALPSGYAAFSGFAGKGPVAQPVAPRFTSLEGRVWGEALYGAGRRSGDGNAASSSFDSAGAIVGVERDLAGGALVGGALGYLNSRGDANGISASRFSFDAFSASAYGRYAFGDFTIRGSVSGAITDTDVKRSIAFGPLGAQASGGASGYSLSGNAMLGYRIPLAARIELNPELGFNLDRIQRDAIVEQGAGALGLTVSGQSVFAARSLLGARLSSFIGAEEALRLDLRAYWSHELADNAMVSRNDLLGAGFAVRSAKASRDGAVIGASLSGRIAPGIELAASYDGDLRDRATSHRFSLGISGRW